VELLKPLQDATVEIFATMLTMDIVPGEPLAAMEQLQTSVTGMVGLAGTHQGVLAIHMPAEVARTVTGQFLGMEVEEINDDVLDAIGELANMLGGGVKAILSEKGRDISLSLPSTICGAGYRFQCMDDVEMILAPFAIAGGQRFFVELQLKNAV